MAPAPSSPAGPSREDVAAARVAAARQHAAVLGDVSACAMSRSGTPFPAGKFWEGHTAALTEVLRSLHDDDVPGAVEKVTGAWVARPAVGNERDAEAYRAGGLEALAALR
ncbi:MAG TPA: hypothetical protein GX743_07385 [Actinomycetales bacterium]|nr:hypothetical protein [Actinomycetales bacterium]